MTNSFIGRTINNRYRLESLLGDGGMGAVYRAHDVNLDRQVALKVMHAHYARQEEFRTRLIQEARTAAKLDHPYIVRVWDFGDSDSGLFIAMEYVDGGSLRDHLRRLQRKRKVLPLKESLQIGAQIAEALDYAFQKGIVHRDIKPGNILLKALNRADEPGELPFRTLLTDFGLVKLQEGLGITQSGATLGTPTYMSPEQCRGEQLDGRSDLYALGVVLYELFTNRLPFNFSNLNEALATHSRGEMPTPASEIRNELPTIIDNILNKALAKDPDDRYEDGAEMANTLRSAMLSLDGAPTQVMVRDEMGILERVSEPPPGYELVIDTPGHPQSSVALTQAMITLGRNADNDIVLPADGVSRHHARLQATALGWEVVDMGGINGTFLNDRRIRADDATPLSVGSSLRIGPYELTLRAPELTFEDLEDSEPRITLGSTAERVAEAATVVTLADVDAANENAPEPEEVGEPLAIFLPNDRISVDPGQRVDVKVEVVNNTQRDDRVSLRVVGLSPSWIVTSSEFVDLPANETRQIIVSIRPTKHRSTPSGRQRFRLEVVSQRNANAKVGVGAFLVVGTFEAFEASLDVEQVVMPGIAVVSVTNTGNTTSYFSVVARDSLGMLRFKGERGRIQLQPGQVAKVELDVSLASSQGLFGSSQLYEFSVEVVGAGTSQTLSGEAVSSPSVPPGLLYAFIFILTFLCVVVGLFIIFGRGLPGFPSTGDRPTNTPTPLTILTETAVIEQTSVAGTATSAAATAEVNGDWDSDGLSNAQETAIGTDPRKPDTDGDQLQDGEEVLTYGSDPLLRDTDADILLDGDEVNTYKTDPADADTDGGSVQDGAEVARGTNPLDPRDDVPATATATASGPTPTWTPVVITNTPLPTATWTPVVITATPLPSTTPTATATATTIPPTETSTVTPTATNTSVPNPQLTCIDPPPNIDGIFDPAEWPNSPLITYFPAGRAAEQTQVYFARDGARLYMAFLINDPTRDSTDSQEIYFDTTNNGGDPDTADRFFKVNRDSSTAVQAGIGNNADGLTWNAGYTTTNWDVQVGESVPSAQWVVELWIDQSAEMPNLANPFSMMLLTDFTGSVSDWPTGADNIDLNTWQGINNVSCP